MINLKHVSEIILFHSDPAKNNSMSGVALESNQQIFSEQTNLTPRKDDHSTNPKVKKNFKQLYKMKMLEIDAMICNCNYQIN